jgi:hypothetical protein
MTPPKMPACGEPVANHRERFAPNDAATASKGEIAFAGTAIRIAYFPQALNAALSWKLGPLCRDALLDWESSCRW